MVFKLMVSQQDCNYFGVKIFVRMVKMGGIKLLHHLFSLEIGQKLSIILFSQKWKIVMRMVINHVQISMIFYLLFVNM